MMMKRNFKMGFSLNEHLNITQVMDLKEGLRVELENAGTLSIDGSQVLRVDATGLQILLSAKNTCKKQSIVWKWEGASDALLEAAQTLGLLEPLGLSDFTK